MIPHHAPLRACARAASQVVFLASLFVVLSNSPAFSADRFKGRVVGVADGDTVTVLRDGRGVKVRLYGVDCPEKKQDFGARAKQFTSAHSFGQDVEVRVVGTDRYKRRLGVVILPDGRNLNQELVRAGYAWWYSRFAPNERTLALLETDARRAKRGLWARGDAIPPWEFRQAARSSGQSNPSRPARLSASVPAP